jgi:hypothetical protein
MEFYHWDDISLNEQTRIALHVAIELLPLDEKEWIHKELISFIDSRFYIGHKDEEAKKHMIYIIESSKDTFSQKISDYIHSYKSISKENHSWFSYWK